MRHLTVRFLKQGLVQFEVPNDIDEEHFIKIAKDKMDKMSDQDLIMAMTDVIPSGMNPTRFDADSFQVEAIEDADNDYELLYASNLWKEYIK